MPSTTNRPSSYTMSVTSRSTAATRIRQDRALAFREAGYSYASIAQVLGYRGPQGAAEACRAARSRQGQVTQAIAAVSPVATTAVPSFPSTRTFGMEFEFKGLSGAQCIATLQNAGIPVHPTINYNHTTMTTWKFVTDGSLSGGNAYEMVSPILRGQAGLEQAMKAVKALRDAGAYVDGECGFHIHVGMDNLTGAQMMSIMDLYIANEANINGVLARSRHNGYWCKANSTAPRYEVTTRDAIRTASLVQAKRIAQNLDKYYAVNLKTYSRQGTMEFRQHQGTLNGKKVEGWLKFVLAIVEAGSAGMTTSFGSLAEMTSGLGFLAEDAQAYLANRQQRLGQR